MVAGGVAVAPPEDNMKTLGFAVALLALATSASGAPYDGSAPLKCAIETVMICSDPSVCVRGTAATALLPRVVTVDVPGRVLGGDAAGRTVKIVSVGHGAGRLLLHGEEVRMSGTAWNVVVEETSGAMTAAVLTHAGGYLAFGSCADK
jgi:hypothetical protein